MILPLYANLEKMDMSLIEAATDLGCQPLKAFFLITVPLSFPGHRRRQHAGLHSGGRRVRDPGTAGRPVEPDDRPRAVVDEFFSNRDWPTASAVAIAILLALVIPLMIYQKYQDKELEKES